MTRRTLSEEDQHRTGGGAAAIDAIARARDNGARSVQNLKVRGEASAKSVREDDVNASTTRNDPRDLWIARIASKHCLGADSGAWKAAPCVEGW